MKYEILDNPYRLEAKVYGRSLPELFENAAYCMYDIMIGVEENSELKETKEQIAITSPNTEDLLINWLNELLYISENKGLVLTEFKVLSLIEKELEAEVSGTSKSFSGLFPKYDIKAVAGLDVKIKMEKKGYSVVISFEK